MPLYVNSLIIPLRLDASQERGMTASRSLLDCSQMLAPLHSSLVGQPSGTRIAHCLRVIISEGRPHLMRVAMAFGRLSRRPWYSSMLLLSRYTLLISW